MPCVWLNSTYCFIKGQGVAWLGLGGGWEDPELFRAGKWELLTGGSRAHPNWRASRFMSLTGNHSTVIKWVVQRNCQNKTEAHIKAVFRSRSSGRGGSLLCCWAPPGSQHLLGNRRMGAKATREGPWQDLSFKASWQGLRCWPVSTAQRSLS